MSTRDLPGLPARAKLDPTGLHLALVDIPPGELRDPFLQETVQRLAATQELAHVPQAELGRMPASSAPAGLIFHVARCGSTLASQLLKLQEGLVVYSEPLAVNEILVPPHTATRADLVAALRTLGAFFAAHARGRPYVLKLTSWNTLFCDIVAEAFPQAPWALCIRDPLQVCVSLQQQRPGWLREENAAMFADLVDPGRTARGPEDRLARVYAAFCEAAGRLDPTRGLLLPYETLPGAIWSKLAPHFGLQITDALQQRMASSSEIYSKSPVGRATPFVPDNERKSATAPAELCSAVDEVARPGYERLLKRLMPAA
jgi:hypothetical protein